MKVLLLNQCFHPDVVATAQHLTDLATALVERGHEVSVVASSRGYDDPRVRFARTETVRGVQVHRVPVPGLGKGAKWRRVVDTASFFAGTSLRVASLGRFDAILALTSPPMIGSLAAIMARWTSSRLLLWIMDLNPDEAIAAGWLDPRSLAGRLLLGSQKRALRRADRVVVLDRFMRDRLAEKGIDGSSVAVVPPWSHDDHVYYDEVGRAAFRQRYGLAGKFVVMYSGNHSPCHPLATVLGAARELAVHRDIAFCFVGGGSEFAPVQVFASRHRLSNILCLPYEPIEGLAGSLAAADMHVVVMGDPYVGIVHPCKIYNILAIGAPFIYVGPRESHVADILRQEETEGWAFGARHGDVEGIASYIRRAAAGHGCERKPAAARAERFSKRMLMPLMIEALGL